MLLHKPAVALLAGILALLLALPTPGRAPQEVTYSKDIWPIVAAKCMPCHKPGGAGPFSLMAYEDVKRRSLLVRQVVLTKQMPPTDATSDYANLVTEPQLTDREMVLFQDWMHGGMKEGTKVPRLAIRDAKWPLGEPDHVIDWPPSVPTKAEGPAYRKVLKLGTQLKERRYLIGFDVRPIDKRLVRAVRIAVDKSRGNEDMFKSGEVRPSAIIGSWTPGHYRWWLPKGHGIPLEPGESIAVEVLYQPSGRIENGALEIGLYFSDEEKPDPPKIQTIGYRDFVLADDKMTTFTERWRLEQDIDLIAIYPEMRQLARQIKVTAQSPGSGTKNVLIVQSYDWFWPGSYVFNKHVRLPKDTVITVEAQYDNTKHAFGDRERQTTIVRKGPKDTDELFWVHLQYAPVKEP